MKTHDGDEIEKMARAHLEPTARVVSDGLGCFRAVTRAGCTHEPVVAAQHCHSEKLQCLRWANTIVGNVQTAITGTLKSVAMRYAFRYLAEFQYRFNRLACVATRAAPRPYKTLKILHVAG